jgi:hypothetical protein
MPVAIVRAGRNHAARHGRARRQASNLHRGKKRLDFDLHGLRQKLPRSGSQDIGQWIVDLVGLTKGNNIASLVHGVSLSLRGSGRLDTRLDTPAYLRPSSPSFPHSSVKGG